MPTQFSLRIVGNNTSRRFDLLPGDVSRVGRGLESNILIQDPNISRQQLTLHVRDAHVDVEMNPQSSNQLIKNGTAAQLTSLVPGEFFDIGPYRFELEATAELPRAAPTGLPPDPAGLIDVKLAEEVRRIAPRWSTVADAAKASTTPGAAPATSEGAMRRVLLPAAVMAVACLLAWDYLASSPTRKTEDPSAATASVDLLGSVAVPQCASDDACLTQAREAFNDGEKLRQSGSKDLITLYRTAKQFHRARLLLTGKEDRLPQLQNSYKRARAELNTAFVDIQFRFERARAEGDLYRQLAALQATLALCAEDRLPLCTDRERIYQQLREHQQTMR